MYENSWSLIDLYAVIMLRFGWIFLVGFIINWLVQTFYFNSQKLVISKLRFLPVFDELCFFDCTSQRIVVMAQFVFLLIAHVFYSVLFVLIGLALRVIVWKTVATMNFSGCNDWLFALIPPYRWYILFTEGLKSYSENEKTNTMKVNKEKLNNGNKSNKPESNKRNG